MKKLKPIITVWGFEGCGAMWTFFSLKKDAEASAGDNSIYNFSVEEAFALDNLRRKDLGFETITFSQFIDCIDASSSCVPPDAEC